MKKSQFKDIIKSEKFTIFVFSAGWCGSCHSFWDNLVESIHKKGLITNSYLIDVDESSEIADELGIIGVPSLYLYNRSQLKYACLGTKTVEEINKILSTCIQTSQETPVR